MNKFAGPVFANIFLATKRIPVPIGEPVNSIPEQVREFTQCNHLNLPPIQLVLFVFRALLFNLFKVDMSIRGGQYHICHRLQKLCFAVTGERGLFMYESLAALL